jgi:hypothetical protein
LAKGTGIRLVASKAQKQSPVKMTRLVVFVLQYNKSGFVYEIIIEYKCIKKCQLAS